MHHSDTGRLDVPAHDGALWVTTVKKFNAMTKPKRFFYRVYHMPIFMFFLGPIVYFLCYYRMWFLGETEDDRRSMVMTNIALIAFGALLYIGIGLDAMVYFVLPTLAVAASLGVWLFFVQHTFEHTYFAHDTEWDKRDAIVHGCSHYKLPRILEWCTGSIGYHALHHLNPSIPSYRLRACWQKVSHAFSESPAFTLRQSLKNIGFTLWDEEKKMLVRFA
jgi:omega-6 fatty acid desaturase (delta-12 desaturase)